jgi:Na+/proline symporter
MNVDLSTFLLLAILFLTIAYRHRQEAKETDSFHIAGWSAGRWAVSASIIALFGAGEIATFTELYGAVGPAIMVFFAGVGAGFIFVGANASRFLNHMRNLTNRNRGALERAYQINDVVLDRYGRVAGGLFTMLAAIALFALFLIQVIVGSDLVAIGSAASYESAVVGISLFIALYVMIGGLHGIYGTDKIQLVALIVALILVAAQALERAPIKISQELSLATSSLSIPVALSLFIPGLSAVFGAADVHQRMISAKEPADLKRVAFASAVGWFALGALLVVFSAGMRAYGTEDTSGFIAMVGSAQGATRVIIIVGLVCALLSTADTELHAVATLINRGVRPWSAPSVRLTRYLIVLVSAIGLLIALRFKDLATLYGILLNISMILGPVVLAVVYERGNAISVIGSLLASSALLFFFAASDLIAGTQYSASPLVLLVALPTVLNLFIPAKRVHA